MSLLPRIQVNDQYGYDLLAEARSALTVRADEERVYSQRGALVRVRIDAATPRVERLGKDALLAVLDRCARWHTLRPDPQTRKPVDHPASCPRELGSRLHADAGWTGLEELRGLLSAPALRRDGTVIGTPGYDATSGMYLAARGLLPRVPEHPTGPQRQTALNLLLDALADFPFVDQSDRANALALLLTPFVRPAVTGTTPLHVVSAHQARAGKGKLIDLGAWIATGGPPATVPLPEGDAEVARTLLAALLAQPAVLKLDEASRIDQRSLASMLTAEVVAGRMMRTSSVAEIPNTATWTAAANNPRIGGDLPWRCVHIRLDPGVVDPSARTGFRHPDLLGWADQHRPELVSAVLTLCRAWYADGCPAYQVPPIGGFQDWARVVGGILDHAGVDGFLANRQAILADAASDDPWPTHVEALLTQFGTAKFSSRDIAAALTAEEGSGPLTSTCPDDLMDAWERRGRAAFLAAYGNAIGSEIGRRLRADGLRLTRDGRVHGGARAYRIVVDASGDALVTVKTAPSPPPSPRFVPPQREIQALGDGGDAENEFVASRAGAGWGTHVRGNPVLASPPSPEGPKPNGHGESGGDGAPGDRHQTVTREEGPSPEGPSPSSPPQASADSEAVVSRLLADGDLGAVEEPGTPGAYDGVDDPQTGGSVPPGQYTDVQPEEGRS